MASAPGQLVDSARSDLHVRLYFERHMESYAELHIRLYTNTALIQRCTLHKRRNCADHLPEAERGWVDARLAKAFNHADPAAGLRMARDLAR